jgi:hypothetical protein
MSKVYVNHPTRAKGELVEVQFLGEFPNGEESEVTDEQKQLWKALTGREWPKSGTLNLDRTPKVKKSEVEEPNSQDVSATEQVPQVANEKTPVASPEAASKPAAGTTTKKEGK